MNLGAKARARVYAVVGVASAAIGLASLHFGGRPFLVFLTTRGVTGVARQAIAFSALMFWCFTVFAVLATLCRRVLGWSTTDKIFTRWVLIGAFSGLFCAWWIAASWAARLFEGWPPALAGVAQVVLAALGVGAIFLAVNRIGRAMGVSMFGGGRDAA